MFLKSNHKNTKFDLIETYREGSQTFCVVSSKNESDAQAVAAQGKELGYRYIGTCVRDGKPSVAFISSKSEADTVKDITQGAPTTAVVISKPFNVWFLRGFMGFSGQALNFRSSFVEGKDMALRTFAGLNLVANGMNMGLGAQLRSDESSLNKVTNEFAHVAAWHGGALLPEPAKDGEQDAAAKGPTAKGAAAVQKSGAKNSELREGSFFARQSVKIQNVLRLVASSVLLVDGMQKFNKLRAASPGASVELPIRAPASALIIPGKLIGMMAQDDDSEKLPQEKRNFWTMFKANANKIGSLIELTGFTLLAYEGIKKRVPVKDELGAIIPGKTKFAWNNAIGQTLFVASYMVQSVAPLSKQVFPMERALQSASLNLQTLEGDARDQAALSMAHSLYGTVPQLRREGLAKTLAQVHRVGETPDQIALASVALSGKKQKAPGTAEITPPERQDQTALASPRSGDQPIPAAAAPEFSAAEIAAQAPATESPAAPVAATPQPTMTHTQASLADRAAGSASSAGHRGRLHSERKEDLAPGKAGILDKHDVAADWKSKAVESDRMGYGVAK